MSPVAAFVAVLLTAEPVAPAVQQAVEARLARQAVEMVSGSLERSAGPACEPYRLFTFEEPRGRSRRGVAVSDQGEVATASDPASLGRFLTASRLFERGAGEALAAWRFLAQAGPLLDSAAIAALPADERASVFPPRAEALPGGQRAVGFIQQGSEVFRVQLDLAAGRAEVTLRSLGEVLGRDGVDEAVRALRSADPILRAAAVFELGSQRDGRAHAALVGALEDRSSEVRATAAQALEQQASADPTRTAATVAALRKALGRETDEATRKAMQAGVERLAPAPAKAQRR